MRLTHPLRDVNPLDAFDNKCKKHCFRVVLYMTKDLWQRKGIYSLRKFRGLGLASAVVGTMIFGIVLPSHAIAANTNVSKSIVSNVNEETDAHVSEKAKGIIRELNDTLVMKTENTAATSDTLFRNDNGLNITEEEKTYVKTITDAFNDMPEIIRSNVNSLTFVRKPNGTYGYTYSKEGHVNMNMQYYHPELTHGELGSAQHFVEVLGHEIGHIFNGKSLRDGDTWSFSRDPKYAELAKEVYGDSMTDNIHGRWATDFGSYVSWISGKSTPQSDGDRKIYSYMDSLFKGILTPREDRITPELKHAVEAAKASGKRLIYDGHVLLDATSENVDKVQSHVDELNRAEVAKVASISDTGHFKTYGINKPATTGHEVGDTNTSKVISATPKESPTYNKQDWNGGVTPSEAPTYEKPEWSGGVTSSEAPTYDKPEWNNSGTNDDGEVLPDEVPVYDKPEFEGGVNPSEASTYDNPEFKGGVNPSEAPTYDNPEFEGGVNPSEAPTYDNPEFKGSVEPKLDRGATPDEAPTHKEPELNSNITSNETPVAKTTESDKPTDSASDVSTDAKQLPNTGESGDSFAAGVIGVITGLLALILSRKFKD